MTGFRITALLCTLVLLTTAVSAETQKSSDPRVNNMTEQLMHASVLTLLCPNPPAIQPRLASSLRRSYTPAADSLVQNYLGGRDNLIGSGQAIVSPLWGRGTRYKSGTVIYALAVDKNQPRVFDMRALKKLESVPAFLDVYRSGYLYTNNVPHKGVTDAFAGKSGPRYNEKDGGAAVQQLLAQQVGQLTAPAGFRKTTTQMIQTFGEHLYVHRIGLEYITSYAVEDKTGKPAGTRPIAVPVLDCYCHVLLDGDKLLAGLEYFWDNSLRADGEVKTALQPAEALMRARGWLMQRYNNAPPLYNVNALRLGYIQDRADPSRLVPAWVFDAWYVSPVPGAGAHTQNAVKQVNDPFAVNAVTGEVIDLMS